MNWNIKNRPLTVRYCFGQFHLLWFFMALLTLSCAGNFVASSASAPAPPWAQTGGVRQIYPDEQYIAQRGNGETRQKAELNALAEIAFYFNSGITTALSSRESDTKKDGLNTYDSQISSETVVESQMKLVAVRYADEPFYNKATKEWSTIAFIARDEAWGIYEPTAKKASDSFLKLFSSAETESDPFSRALRYDAARAYTRTPEFSSARDFSMVLHPSKADALFAETNRALSALPEKSYSARQNAPVYIDCPMDVDGLLRSAAVNALKTAGFPTETNRNRAAAVCAISVEEGKPAVSEGTAYKITLTAQVSGQTGALFSFSCEGPRKSAYNPEKARQDAYRALAEIYGGSFSQAFNNKLTEVRP
ncbi:hypothetical protein LQZ19_05610 [Treponema primitia]|uniref:hypothetical protein n=1 Tax=Treponema primitia TaxID=88058 RepID=UPI003980F9FE